MNIFDMIECIEQQQRWHCHCRGRCLWAKRNINWLNVCECAAHFIKRTDPTGRIKNGLWGEMNQGCAK